MRAFLLHGYMLLASILSVAMVFVHHFEWQYNIIAGACLIGLWLTVAYDPKFRRG